MDKMLENEKKRGRERKVVATRIVRTEVYDRKVRGGGIWSALRPLRGTHFTHKEHPSRVLTPGCHVLATNNEREGEKERKKRKHIGNLFEQKNQRYY